jgi:hypothetical protein
MDFSTLECRQIPRRGSFSRLAPMSRIPRSPIVLGIAALAALGLVACGDEDAKLLPGGTAREITANLDTVQQLSDEGDCVGAESAARQVGEQIEALEDVDRKLKRALEDGADRLEEVIAECDEEVEALTPTTTEDEAASAEGEREAKEREKEAEKTEKEAEKREKEDKQEETPSLPPPANGEGKGLEKEHGPPPSEEAPEEPPAESPSGGVSPGSPAGRGE